MAEMRLTEMTFQADVSIKSSMLKRVTTEPSSSDTSTVRHVKEIVVNNLGAFITWSREQDIKQFGSTPTWVPMQNINNGRVFVEKPAETKAAVK